MVKDLSIIGDTLQKTQGRKKEKDPLSRVFFTMVLAPISRILYLPK